MKFSLVNIEQETSGTQKKVCFYLVSLPTKSLARSDIIFSIYVFILLLKLSQTKYVTHELIRFFLTIQHRETNSWHPNYLLVWIEAYYIRGSNEGESLPKVLPMPNKRIGMLQALLLTHCC